MKQHRIDSPGAASDADASPSIPAAEGPDAAAQPPARIGCIEACPEPGRRGHLPDLVEPLVPRDPDTIFSETRRLRHDGWTPQKQRLFLERFAECGVIVEACEAAGMSARSAYNLRDRDPLFAAGWEAACVMARPPLADEAYSRARNGVVERIYKDGIVVAERHRYDNRLTMSVLSRLDARIDRAEEQGAAHLHLVARWDDYLAALGDDRREEGLALLAPPAPEPAPPAAAAGLGENAGDRELRELHQAHASSIDRDGHEVWEDEEGWWTDYPPPAGFDGEEHGAYGEDDYRRTLSPDEQAVIDADLAEEEAADLALAQAQRDAYFGLGPDPAIDDELEDEDDEADPDDDADADAAPGEDRFPQPCDAPIVRLSANPG